LEAEKKNLEKHFYERTVNMLKNIENQENNNIRNKIKEIVDSTVKTVFQVKKIILSLEIRKFPTQTRIY
jgi:hypothetical protein